jgi:PAS domain S-box-containing protein
MPEDNTPSSEPLPEGPLLDAIVQSSDDAIVTKDLNGIVTSWNQAAERIFGYTAEEMIGQSITNLIPTDQPEEEPQILERIRRGERIDHYETIRRRKDGTEIDVSVTISPIRNAKGRIIGASKMARDITMGKQVALESALLAAIVQSSDDAIVSKDLNGVVTSWNQAAERIFGYTAEEMIGQPIVILIPPDRPNEEPRILERIRRGERVDHYETIRRRKDGTLINVSVTISPIRNQRGEVVGASKVARDITGQKRMEAELRRFADDLAEQHRQKDEFLAMLAHELRNPLAPMRTALEILRLRPGDPEQIKRVRETLDRQVKNLGRLVEDLLDVSRITQGKMTPRLERVDLVRLVRFNCQHYELHAEASGLTLECHAPEIPIWILGDPTRLDQMLDNLLENAIKFTERGGQVSVRVEPEGENALVVIRDTGVGIEASMLPHLFSTFTQAEQSLARSRGGLGLGLAIVKGLAELHGGSIEAHSAGVGHGSEFRLLLPVEGELPALTASTPTAAPVTHSRRILLVEDNRDAADSLADLLRIFGYEVRVAYSGTEGVEAAHLFLPEIVLCDIGLPGLDGYEVARRLRQDAGTAAARLIAITGYGTDSDREKTRDAGFDRHLVKPVDPDHLLDEIGCAGE